MENSHSSILVDDVNNDDDDDDDWHDINFKKWKRVYTDCITK